MSNDKFVMKTNTKIAMNTLMAIIEIRTTKDSGVTTSDIAMASATEIEIQRKSVAIVKKIPTKKTNIAVDCLNILII